MITNNCKTDEAGQYPQDELSFQELEYRTYVTPGGRRATQPLCPGGSVGMEVASEPVCSREGTSVTHIKNC